MASREELREALGVEARTLSYPYGRSTAAVRELARRVGYVAACGIEQREHTLLDLSRVDVARCGESRLLWWWRVSGLHFRLRRHPLLRGARGALRRRGRQAM